MTYVGKESKKEWRDFPGDPVVKNLPSNTVDMSWFLVQKLRPHMPQGN